MPSHDDCSNTEDETLRAYCFSAVATVGLESFFFLLSQQVYLAFSFSGTRLLNLLCSSIKFDTPFPSLSFSDYKKGGLELLGSWQGSHLVSLLPAQAAGGV